MRQGMFPVPKATGNQFSTVLVPFSSLVAVRGPVINPNAPPFKKDTVYQIGMVISKFKIAASMEVRSCVLGMSTDRPTPPCVERSVTMVTKQMNRVYM